MPFKNKILLLCALLLAACQPKANSDANKPATASQQASAPQQQDKPATTKRYTPPAPGVVIATAFHKKGDGSESYEIGNGAWATYWYGHRFELDGKQYFTGLMYKSPDNPDAAGDPQAPLPDGVDDRMSLAQATFVQNPPTDKKHWSLASTQRGIGKFGGLIVGLRKGLDIDPEQKAVSHLTPADNYLLAIPTSTLIGQGTSQKTREIFLFNKKSQQWLYAGSVEAGENNSGNCPDPAGKDDMDLPPCIDSIAKLEFIAQPNSDMPLIRVHLQGTTSSETSGKVRKLGARDTQNYVFSSKTGQYQQTKNKLNILK